MLIFFLIFLIRFLVFIKNVFFLGFSLLLLRCFMVIYIWNLVSQWMGLVFFLVYITGVIVIFIFFCSFSKTTGGLIFKPLYVLLFFLCLGSSELIFFFANDAKNLRESRRFYSMNEIGQIFLLGFWLVFVLWGSLKILNVLGGVIR